MTVRALLFDFDGTIWDSEAAGYEAWRETFARFGLTFAVPTFAAPIGTIGAGDPLDELEAELGHSVDRKAVGERRWARKVELLEQLRPRPGIQDYLGEARARGLARVVVSTSDGGFIRRGLDHLGLADAFDFIECADRDRAVAKPRPTLYLSALRRLDLPAAEAIAIEDSPNGIAAAKGAGLFCLAASNSITRAMDLSAADIVVEPLDEISLDDLLAEAEARRSTAPD